MTGDLQRITNKYSGIKLCEMSSEQLEEFLGGIAKRASADTLKAMGLSDEYAVDDIRDLRDILKGFRVIRKSAITVTLATTGRVLAWACIIGIAAIVYHNNPVVKKTVVDFIAP